MANSLKRPISMLLILLLMISLFTVFPAVSAGAAANTSDAWIFAANDGRTYDLDGKWVRFGDDDFQLSGTGEFTLTNRTTYIFQLKYGTTHIADSRSTQAGAVNIGNTFYVTGQGTEDHPYIFTPNVIFYDNTVTTFGKGATVSMGYENLEATASGNNGVAVPGDGFKSVSRMQVGASNYVRFLQHDETDYQPNQVSTVLGYIGVKDGEYGTYNGSGNFTNTTNHFAFESGNDTLYYMGRDDYGENGLYRFSETVDKRTNFNGTNKVICTVTWENQDGIKLRTMTYNLGEIADDGGLKPEKAEDAAYTYRFTGFEPAYAPLTDDMTYVATYEATPKGTLTYSVDAWIFSTNDGKVYNELAGMCFSYNGGLATGFTSGGSFSVIDNQLLLCGVHVADIDTSQPAYKTFANTVYVTGDGSPEDPFVFHPNYIYGDDSKENVKDGISVAVDEGHYSPGVDKGFANPGDGFKGMSRIRVYNNNEQSNKDLYKIQFLQQNGLFRPSRYFLGVGEDTYGYRYSKTKALPFSYVTGSRTLYYFEETSGGIYQFSETEPPLRSDFSGSSESTIHTVTWKNDDGTVLDTESYYVGATPTYKGTTPTKTPTADTKYSFTYWTDNSGDHYEPASLPAVTTDVTYTANYSESTRLFSLHSLTLNGDIGVNFFLNVTPAQINTGEGVVVNFSYDVDGKTKTSSYKLNTSEFITYEGNNYYKATCWVAAAEMTYDIHATATINGVLQDETNDYSVRDYADVILSPSYATAHPENYEELASLVKAMLDYGAKAQVVFNRKTDDLANNGIDYSMVDVSAETIASPRKTMEDDSLSEYGLEYYTSSVIFLSKTTLRHYYYVTDRNKFDAVKSSITFSGNGADGVCVDKDYYVYFDIADIAAADFDAVYTLRFDADHSYDFSVLDYASYIVENNKDNNQKELGKATYWYNVYANTYFALVNNNG